jgi:RNA-directed DNA polymerase
LLKAYPKRHKPAVIRFADDVVILHHDLDQLQQVKHQAESWLSQIGLRLNPSKTYLAHTLNDFEGQAGFDFLGFNIRQYHVGRYKTRTYRGQAGFPGQAARTGKTLIRPSKKAQKRHLAHLKQVIRDYRGSSQGGLSGKLNPIIRGWANYYKTCTAKKIFNQMSVRPTLLQVTSLGCLSSSQKMAELVLSSLLETTGWAYPFHRWGTLPIPI